MTCARCGLPSDGADLCVECWDAKVDGRQTDEERRAKKRAAGHRYYQAHAERIRAAWRAYYWAHREAKLASGAAFRARKRLDTPPAQG